MTKIIVFPIFAITFLSLYSCRRMSNNDNKKMLTNDLKFPALYEIDWASRLPKPNRDYIRDNNVRSAFSFIEVGKPSEYAHNLRALYAESRQPNEGFTAWFWRHTGCLDSSGYDVNGHLMMYKQNCLMCGTTTYKYDSLGFIKIHHVGGCVLRDYYYKHYFDPESRELYYCDTAVSFSSHENVAKLSFDTSGYLTSFKYNDIGFGCLSFTQYQYNEQRQISTIERRDSIIPGSEHSKEPWPINIGSFSTYYYTQNHLDSIVTNYLVNHFDGVHHVQKIYFDRSGLPSKSVYLNFPGGHKTSYARRYRYHSF